MLTFISSEVKPYMPAFSFDHMGTIEIASREQAANYEWK